MELSALAKWPAYVFLLATMVGLGLQVAPMELANTLRNGRVVARALIANCVAAPLLGLLVATLLPLSPDVRTGILLVSLAPGSVAAVQFTSKARESLSYAAALELVLAAAALLLAPLWLVLLLGSHPPLPIAQTLARLLALLLLPLAMGLGIRARWPKVGKRLEGPVVAIGSLAFMVNVALTAAGKNEAVRAIAWTEAGVMFGLVLCFMAVGWSLGGPLRTDRRVLASATGFRNVAMALVVALHWFPSSNVDTAVLAFSLLMIPPNAGLMAWEALRARRAARAQA